MTEGKRPGGLTALAVFNFVFGALSFFVTLMLLALPLGMERFKQVAERNGDREALAQMEALEQLGLGFFLVLASITLVSALLMVMSGIGYLLQKKFLGRGVGNAYAIFGVATTVVSLVAVPAEISGGFGIKTIINLSYPVLTLVLINGTFKEDFIR